MLKKTMKIASFFALMILLVFSSTSCKKKKSLSELRREERQAINNYIKDNNINVIYELPADTIFTNENDYYLSPSGLYIHIDNKGEGQPPQAGEKIIVRYYEMTLNGDTISSKMSAQDATTAYEFEYNITNSAPYFPYYSAGFNEAAGYMGENGEAHIIVPHDIGFQWTKESITPCYYHIKTKIQ